MEKNVMRTPIKDKEDVLQNQSKCPKKAKCDVFQNCLKMTLSESNSRRILEANSGFCVRSTPPSLSKIKNPFETGLTENLHLPLICSPSLFQKPQSPGHFEWTIDDVSSLNPVNVEPNATQFQSVSDPEVEARAQAAINSYFKHQPVAPSPIDCILRKQRITLAFDIEKSVEKKKVQRIRDGVCQTELTFPSNLPMEIEKLLSGFCTYICNQQQSPPICENVSITSQDISLRRKLFECSAYPDDEVYVSSPPDVKTSSPAPTTPELNMPHTRSYSLDSLHICSKHEQLGINHPTQNEVFFFGSLSPIAKFGNDSDLDSDNRDRKRLNDENNDSISGKSTREDVKEPLKAKDSMNSITQACSMIGKPLNFPENRCSYVSAVECFEMQISKSSSKSNSSSSSSQNESTPMRKRRSSGRKNLSRSFSCHRSDSDTDNEKENHLTTLNKSTSAVTEFTSKIEPTVKWL